MLDFALIGAGGYVAPRHMRAIRDTGNRIVACLDKTDSVGIIDSYFPEADFFVEFERFDRHIDLLNRKGKGPEYTSVCSPNYLHDAHVRFALRSGSHAICEKPLVLNPWNLDGLLEAEKGSGRTVSSILQLRLHPSIKALKQKVADANVDRYDIDLSYFTSRGHWYFVSWKGDVEKSGGLATNIGVHFFDMLHFVFGAVQDIRLHYSTPSTMAGYVEYERARVRWLLSVDADNLPKIAVENGLRTYRSLTMNGDEIEFSGGFTDLHTESYKEILAGNGFGIEANRSAVETVSTIRHLTPIGLAGDYHPMLKEIAGNKSSPRSGY